MEPHPRRRWTAVIFWVFAGSMHFARPHLYDSIVPRSLARWKRELTIASGVAELAGGLAIVPERTRRGARWWLLATLIAVFPANIQMALNPQRYKQIPAALLWVRLPFQGLFAWMTWRGTH